MTIITKSDLVLASVYFPILVEVAKTGKLITYSQLVDQAKSLYPEDPIVQNAIAVSTGRRLDVVRMFTKDAKCPDLTSLVVNKAKGECGDGFTRSYNPEIVRDEVHRHDWNKVKTDFEGFLEITEKKIKPRKKISKAQAGELRFKYYIENKNSLPLEIREYRDFLDECIMEGMEVADAFSECISLINRNDSNTL